MTASNKKTGIASNKKEVTAASNKKTGIASNRKEVEQEDSIRRK